MNVNDKKGRLITLRNALTGEEVEIISTVTQADLDTKQDKFQTESLQTESKDIVEAINEINNKTESLNQTIGVEELSTTSKEVIGAINELNAKTNSISDIYASAFESLSSLPDTLNQVQDAVNELDDKVNNNNTITANVQTQLTDITEELNTCQTNLNILDNKILQLDPSTSLFANYGPHTKSKEEVVADLISTNNIQIGTLIAILDENETLTEYQCTKTYDYTSIRFFDDNNGWVICESKTRESEDYEVWYSQDTDRTFYVHKENKTVSILAGDGETFIQIASSYTHPVTWTAVERYKLEVQKIK